ncbi:MAG: response regulator transcription factor [Caldilineaceae bacterium]
MASIPGYLKMEPRPIRILIADDHVMVRIGITTMLKVFDELILVGAATNGQSAIDMCDELAPDLVLMDVHMPEVDGIAATRIIRQQHPEIKVLALTGYADDNGVRKALQAGASGYMLKSASLDELIAAIYGVFAGQIILSPQAATALVQGSTSAPENDYGLTNREYEVLQLMLDGLSNQAIADHINVSPLTVKSHVSSVLAKLHVATRTEAVALANRRGLSH